MKRSCKPPVKPGQRYGRLIVVELAPFLPNNPNRRWHCQCDCGALATAYTFALNSGYKTDCGRHKMRERPPIVRHGLTSNSKTNEFYRIWWNMLERCSNPEHQAFKYYGGRGIKVCDRWRNGEFGAHGAACFMADIGPRPTPQHTVDRIDNDGPYAPDNCRWATRAEQQRKKRSVKIIAWRDKSQTLTEWSEQSGIPYSTLYFRIKSGWHLDRALTEPVRRWQ